MIRDSSEQYQPIENYGLIGDLRCAALVGLNGSIDFMSFPDFDSPTIFARLLDYHKGGYFALSPMHTYENVKSKQLYLPETNILLTRFLLPDGIGEIIDFMPVAEVCKENILVRRIMSIKGEISFKMRCCPRFNYAMDPHVAKPIGNKEITFITKGAKKGSLKLIASVSLKIEDQDVVAEFTLKQGEMADFLLENIRETESFIPAYSREFVDGLFHQTLVYWKGWSAKCSYIGRWRETVIRSALVLKLLTSQRYGSIIAAPTFGLPERIGGGQNWDYRYVWIRDASFVIYAMIRLGYKDEAGNFMKWLMSVLQKQKRLRIVYGIDGRIKLPESELGQFEGYMGSSPVRIGNEAYTQRQLDIYGELIDAIYLYDNYVSPITHDEWEAVKEQVNWISKNWRKPDHGIWEIRQQEKKYLHSRVMCWVALDRALRLAERRSLPIPSHWVHERDKIYNSVFTDFWSDQKKAFVAYEGAKQIDASCLLMPLMRFISPKDPLWLSTLKSIESDLVVGDLVYRYPKSRKEMQEGTFSLCSFWYAECLSRAGQLDKALFNFEKMHTYANHLGLYSEQLGFQGNHLGNFPQALSHLSLISAAYDLNKRLDHPSK